MFVRHISLLIKDSSDLATPRTGEHDRMLNSSQEHTEQREHFSNRSLPDVLSMLVHRNEVLLVRISWNLACLLTLRLEIVARVRPHRDQLQVYRLDLLFFPIVYGEWKIIEIVTARCQSEISLEFLSREYLSQSCNSKFNEKQQLLHQIGL